jgi:diadenosine tetraphosphate (Ap4A) HIT family hydrolase
MLDKSRQCPHCEGGFGLQYPLHANDNFWIVCDSHPIVEGHTLIIPKNHISCTGALSYELFNEYRSLYKKVLNFLNETYGNAVIFEHGVVGQTVSHAHVHFLPFDKSIEDIVNEKNLLKPIDNLEEIRNIFSKEKMVT